MFLLYVIKIYVEYYSLRFELKKNAKNQTQITFQHIKKPLWRSFHTFYVILGI